MILLKRLGVNIVTYGYGWGVLAEVPAIVGVPFPLAVMDVYGGDIPRVEPEVIARATGTISGRRFVLGGERGTIARRCGTISGERGTLSTGKSRPISRR